MKIKKGWLGLFIVLISFIGIHVVQAEDILDDFNKELENYLKVYDNVEITKSKNEIGDQIVNISIQLDNETFTNSYVYKDGIISYHLKSTVNSSDAYNKEFSIEVKIMLSITQAFYSVKGYDEDDFLKWSYSLTDMQLNNLTIEHDGISMKREKITQEENGVTSSIMTYTTELNLDLVNGIKSHTFKPKEEETEDNSRGEEVNEHIDETRKDKINLTYLIPILFFIDLMGILIIYFIKKKSVRGA